MSITTKATLAAMILIVFGTSTHAQEGMSLKARLLHRLSGTQGAQASVVPASTSSPAGVAGQGADPGSFARILNGYRATLGLHPLVYDAELSAWATRNNAAQNWRGIGHHVVPNCFQNCAWNVGDSWSAFQSWLNSAGHRANLLHPSATRFGIAYGPGPYWTFNAR